MSNILSSHADYKTAIQKQVRTKMSGHLQNVLQQTIKTQGEFNIVAMKKYIHEENAEKATVNRLAE